MHVLAGATAQNNLLELVSRTANYHIAPKSRMITPGFFPSIWLRTVKHDDTTSVLKRLGINRPIQGLPRPICNFGKTLYVKRFLAKKYAPVSAEHSVYH